MFWNVGPRQTGAPKHIVCYTGNKQALRLTVIMRATKMKLNIVNANIDTRHFTNGQNVPALLDSVVMNSP